jgi:hypothetical protein
MFDADWVKHGYMEQAVSLMETWARAQDVIPGMTWRWCAWKAARR